VPPAGAGSGSQAAAVQHRHALGDGQAQAADAAARAPQRRVAQRLAAFQAQRQFGGQAGACHPRR
jgi:hypothetical protein